MGIHPYTKILKKATPTIRLADGVVKKWEVEVIFKSTEDGWNRTYPGDEEVEWMNKKPEDFTKEELIAFCTMPDAVFDAHYEAFNSPPKETRVGDFDLSKLK